MKPNKEKDFVSRVRWKYFFKQKLEEISEPLLIIALVTLIPYLLGLVLGFIFSVPSENNLIVDLLLTWILGLALISFVSIIIIFLYKIIRWLKSNMFIAEQKAKREFKKRR